jgi:UDP-glucose:(heptosyl)LPS alpha-1,3-glucosyltransferase
MTPARTSQLAVVRRRWIPDGGGERFTKLLAEGFARAGCATTILSACWEQPEDPVVWRRVPALERGESASLLSFTVNVARHLRRAHYDLVQSHAKLLWQDIYRAGDGCHREWLRVRAAHAAALCRRRPGLTNRDRLILLLERNLLARKRYRLIVAISARVREDLIRHYAVPPGDIRVVYNGVDIERFHPATSWRLREAARSLLEVPRRAFVALFLGTGFERKGLTYLLRALPAAGENVRLLVAGRDARSESYKALARSLGIEHRVKFLGPVTPPESAYAAADVFVLPTIYEPFSNACLEALACGLPVVTTRAAGVSELLSGGLRALTLESASDHAAIAERLGRLQDPREREILGAEARAVAESRSLDTAVNEFLEVHQALEVHRTAAASQRRRIR